MSSRPSRLAMAAAALLTTTFALGAAWQPENPKPAPDQPPGGRPGRGPGGPGQPGGPGERGGPRGGGASLEAGMKGMNRALKQLTGQVADAAKKDENLRLIGDLERSAIVAKSSPLPEDVLKKAKDDAERTKWTTDTRKHLMTIVRLGLDAEQDIMDGKGADAAKKLAEIAKIRDDSHKALGIKDE